VKSSQAVTTFRHSVQTKTVKLRPEVQLTNLVWWTWRCSYSGSSSSGRWRLQCEHIIPSQHR